MSKSTTPADPTVSSTVPTRPEVTPTLKGYTVKVGKDSPVSTVRSAGIVFTSAPQMFGLDHPALTELRNNPWLETTEMTE